MAEFMKEPGKTENSMGMEDTEASKVKKNLDFGEMAQEKDGSRRMNLFKLKPKAISIF